MDAGSLVIGIALGTLLTIATYTGRGRCPVNLAKPARVPIGRYLGGFPLASNLEDEVDCNIDEAALVFVTKHNREFGRIPDLQLSTFFARKSRSYCRGSQQRSILPFPTSVSV
jgi:hypothetical protein